MLPLIGVTDGADSASAGRAVNRRTDQDHSTLRLIMGRTHKVQQPRPPFRLAPLELKG